MERLVIKVPKKKSALVKALLKELGVKIETEPNQITLKAIRDARNRVELTEPISDVATFIKSL